MALAHSPQNKPLLLKRKFIEQLGGLTAHDAVLSGELFFGRQQPVRPGAEHDLRTQHVAHFAAAGYGVATLIPAAMQVADELPGLKHGAGLTIVSWLLRLGFLLSPPIVGLVADNAGLRTGLLVVPIAGVVAVLFAWALNGRAARATGRAE